MKSRRFVIAMFSMILIFILGILGNDGSVMAIASVAIGIAGAAAADTFSENKYQKKKHDKNLEITTPSPKAFDPDEE